GAEPAEVERLSDHALPGERGIAVDHDRQRSRRIEMRRGTVARGLLGARTAIDNRTDELEMARVRRQRDVDGAAIGSAERTLGAVMVLHVTGAAVGSHHPLEMLAALELGEDRLVRATHHVSERVESTTMRHSQHGVAHAALRCELEREDRKSTRLNSSHVKTSYAVFCFKKKTRPKGR